MTGILFGDDEFDILFTHMCLHEAIGDALVDGRSLIDDPRDELCPDDDGVMMSGVYP